MTLKNLVLAMVTPPRGSLMLKGAWTTLQAPLRFLWINSNAIERTAGLVSTRHARPGNQCQVYRLRQAKPRSTLQRYGQTVLTVAIPRFLSAWSASDPGTSGGRNSTRAS